MSLVISTNLNSLVVQNNLAANQPQLASAMQRLSSGLRLNSAADDAAGLAIATGLNSQSGGDTVAVQNANNASSLAQIADGALASVTNDLQTLRNLAVESANGTNSATDRAALNIQAQQVIADIQNSASTTNYNGVNLLNGGFSSQFQIGANAGQTINLNIANVQTNTLGAGQGTGVSAQGQASTYTGPTWTSTLSPIKAGDLVINGVIVPQSLSTSYNASFTGGDTSGNITAANNASAATSAIAKVAAINSVSSQSGVSAVVDSNVVGGTSMATASSLTGTVAINGIPIAISTSASFTNDANRNAIVTAINAYQGQTGVVATNTGSDATGIQLSAADGRNISVDFLTTGGPMTAAASGLAATGTYSGGYTLTSANNGPITIQQGTGTLANSGLQPGSFTPSQATVSSASLGNVSTGTGMASGDLVINGVSIQASNTTNDNLSYTQQSNSSIAITAAINQSSTQTGVVAKVNSNVIQGSSFTAATVGQSGSLIINGVATSVLTATGVASTDLTNETNAINAISGQTGVSASNDGSNIKLSASDGRNITLTYGGGTFTTPNTALGLPSSVLNAATTFVGIVGGASTFTPSPTPTADVGKTFVLTIDGVSSGAITLSGSASTNNTNIYTALHDMQLPTGVSATSVSSTQFSLSDTANVTLNIGWYSTENIAASSINGATGSTGAPLSGGLTTTSNNEVTTAGSYTLTSAGTIKVGSTTGNSNTDAGMLQGSYGGTTNGTFLSQVDISTVSGANSAIVAVDNALNTVNAIRANIGAFQNRMSATVSNLQSQGTNLTAAYTSITGADFAKETANLSRAQVLQQAGIAVLAQANALSQQVLNLLR
ncbi:MAG: hypothetical protein HKM02_06305 [Pseudomonadales bacterium]|nr:hypothetical protein [Pseudomonadales bacterium]